MLLSGLFSSTLHGFRIGKAGCCLYRWKRLSKLIENGRDHKKKACVRKYCHIKQCTDKVSWRNFQAQREIEDGSLYGIFQFQIWTRNDNEFFELEDGREKRRFSLLPVSLRFQISFNHSMLAFFSVKWHKNFRNILKMRISIKINFIGEMLLILNVTFIKEVWLALPCFYFIDFLRTDSFIVHVLFCACCFGLGWLLV